MTSIDAACLERAFLPGLVSAVAHRAHAATSARDLASLLTNSAGKLAPSNGCEAPPVAILASPSAKSADGGGRTRARRSAVMQARPAFDVELGHLQYAHARVAGPIASTVDAYAS